MELVPRLVNQRGVDLNSSDLARRNDFATLALNVEYTQRGAINKRPGYQGYAANAGGYGQWTYNRFDPSTGAEDKMIVSIDQNLHKLLKASLTVTYAGAATSSTISIFLNAETNTYHCQISEDAVLVLDTSLDVGFDELTPKTISDLAAEINAIAGYTAAAIGDGSVPAAFLKIVREYEIKNQTLTTFAGYWSEVNSVTANPLSAYLSNKFESDHENVSIAFLQNCLYFGSGFSETMKFDGQTFYRAGLPTPSVPTSAIGAAGAITGTSYLHKIQYAQYDAAGNIIEGNHTNVATGISPTLQKMTVTVPNVLAGTGFNTNCAIVNGIQATINTITVDDGSGNPHTMQVGDTAYFYDSISAAYVTRRVSAVAQFSITVEGAAVTVADNAVISNNLRILVWRTKTAGTIVSTFYLQSEIPNNSFASTQVVSDNLTDTQLGETFQAPLTDRSPPPRGRYVTSVDNLLIVAGIPTQKAVLAYSTEDSCEYFPSDSNQLLIDTGNGDIITGVKQCGTVLVVMGDNSFTSISGDLAAGQIRLETFLGTGCASHSSIQHKDGTLYWLSSDGPRKSRGGLRPEPLGLALEDTPDTEARKSRIDSAFNNDGLVEELKVRHKRAVGYLDIKKGYYLLFVPSEFGDDTLRYATSNSLVWAYDISRDAWLPWNNLNFAGGMSELDGELFFQERRYSTYETSVQSICYRRHNLLDAWDYADNLEAIELDNAPQWETLGQPAVLKDPLNLKVYSLESVANNEFTLTCIQENNFQTDVPVANFDMAFTGGGYGYMPYGDAAYGDPSNDSKTHSLARDRIRAMRIRFTNTNLHENVLISGWEIEWATPHRAEFKA